MNAMHEVAPARARWIRLPALPRGCAPEGIRHSQVELRQNIRNVFLRNLGSMARETASQAKAGSKHRTGAPNMSGGEHYFASTHFHPSVHNLFHVLDKRDRLPGRVPKATVDRLPSRCNFTKADKIDDDSGDYYPAPSYPHDMAMDELRQYQRLARRQTGLPFSTPPNKNKRQRAPLAVLDHNVSPTTLDIRIAAANAREDPESTGAELAALHANTAVLLAQLEQQRKKIAEQYESIAALKELNVSAATNDFVDTTAPAGGLSRFNLLSPAWHARNQGAAKFYFGFKNWSETCVYITEILWPYLVIPSYDSPCAAASVPISEFERCLVSKMFMHRDMERQALAIIWGCDYREIGPMIDDWIPEWGEMGEFLSTLPLTAEYLEDTKPKSYDQVGLHKIAALPDGKDFMIHTPRANPLITRAAYSDKVHHSAVRCISWSTPCGLYFAHTPLFLARVSEKKLVELWGPRLSSVPPGYRMLADRGFAGTARYYPTFSAQLTPKFLSGRKQFGVKEVSDDWRICQLRYTCEVAFARVTTETILRDVIPYKHLKYINHINNWAHSASNFCQPLQK